MYTKLSDAVLAKGTTEAYPPFVVKDGDVSLGAVLLVKQFNDKLVLVFERDALRVIKSLADMATFTTLVADLKASNKAVSYPSNVAEFMDPAARFKDYLETGQSFGLDTPVGLPAEYRFVRDAFVTAFTPPTPPTPPRTFAPEFAITGAEAIEWFAVTDNKLSTASSNLANLVGRNNLLRIGYNKEGAPVRLINGGGYSVTIKQAERLWTRYLKEDWRNKPVSGVTIRDRWNTFDVQGRGVAIYADRIEIGCQTISRAAIERVARILNWEM